jgi:hypothetical protein
VHDYLAAYKATGKPPRPCPQSPDTPSARAALGLAPLFVPTAVPVPVDDLSGTNTTTNAPATLPADLPAIHAFRPTKSAASSERFESLSAQTLYSHFSHEVGFRPRTIGAIINASHWQPRFFLLSFQPS